MLKRALCSVIGLWLIMTVAQAQEAVWSVWLVDAPTGQMTQVDRDGALLDLYTLPMADGFDRYPTRVARSSLNGLTAYVVYNSTTFQGALMIAQRDQMLLTLRLPPTFSDSTEFVADGSLFNADASRLALGYSLEGSGWAIIVVDLRTGSIIYTLRHDMPTVGLLGLSAAPGITPVVRRFDGAVISFTLVDAGTGGPGPYLSYDWNFENDELLTNPAWPSLDADVLRATGEVIMSLPESRLPSQPNDFPLFQVNSLQVYDRASGARYPFFNQADATLQTPRFIQNGELILTDSSTVSGRFAWQVLRRDGSLVGMLPSVVSISDVRGVPDGLVYTTEDFNPGATTLIYVNTRDGLDAGIPLWTSSPGATPIITAIEESGLVAQVAYMPWAQLAPPEYAPGSQPAIAPAPEQPLLISPGEVTTPVVTPIIRGVLVVGGLATVQTTEGDQLNVRLGPGLNFEVVAKLNPLAQVTILEGPRSADGYTWWKIRTGSGITGWAVESVDDNGVRLQTLIPS